MTIVEIRLNHFSNLFNKFNFKIMTKVIFQLESNSMKTEMSKLSGECVSSKHFKVYECHFQSVNNNKNFVRILECYQLRKCLLSTRLWRFLSLSLIQEHFGSTQLDSDNPKSCRSTANPLMEGIFRAMYLSRLTDGKDNENAIGFFAEHWYNLQQTQNFF